LPSFLAPSREGCLLNASSHDYSMRSADRQLSGSLAGAVNGRNGAVGSTDRRNTFNLRG